MQISRRDLIACAAAGVLTPAFVAKASPRTEKPFPDLAAELGVCAVSYCRLSAGKPLVPEVLSGCGPNQTVDRKALFQAASLTKPVTAFVALTLTEQGRLDLDAPVSDYLPEGYAHLQRPFTDPYDPRFDLVTANVLKSVPVRTLLNHSSGLPNWTHRNLVPAFPAGTHWQYSGEGYALLQAVISAVMAQDFEKSVAEHVFTPLGMHSSRLQFAEDIAERLVSGTSRSGKHKQLVFRRANGAASLYTTAEDYAKFTQAVLSRPAITALTLDNPIEVVPKLGLSWGQGWGVENAEGGPYLWHWGNNPGFRAFVMVSVVSGDGFVILTNSERGMPLAASLARAVIPADHGAFRFSLVN
ncbi:MAG: serine hydrolase domain-containing protein [Asticcacaulis sp.]